MTRSIQIDTPNGKAFIDERWDTPTIRESLNTLMSNHRENLKEYPSRPSKKPNVKS